MIERFFIFVLIICITFSSSAQERVGNLLFNPKVAHKSQFFNKTTTLLTLPFFEDFTDDSPLPNPTRWEDASVYINNTMGFNPVSRGVATFDALNAKGGPYDSSSSLALVYADSLTTHPIDLSGFGPGDSLYLSFFFQPQGNGFAPETQDSLLLYFKKQNGQWKKVWSVDGGNLQPFRQILIGLYDSSYFHENFQFRFVNKASINLNDDHWQLDYIQLSNARSWDDTLIRDVATTFQPSYLLNDFTAMPYRQFQGFATSELAPSHFFTVKNNYGFPQSINYGYSATEMVTGTNLFSSTTNSGILAPYQSQQYSFNTYNSNFTAANIHDRVEFQQKYFITTSSVTESKINDTIVCHQVFDNNLAYDDGTAEKSYFLNQFVTLPAKTAIEFKLNKKDTLQGVAIYFARQVPIAMNKFFSIAVYKNIAFNGGTEQKIYQQDLLYPGYDSINHFWIYRLDTPIVLDAGTFYVGTIQPTSTGSDSLYFGLDVNRIGGNHLYYNVMNTWESSSVSGALMIRPLLGQKVVGTNVSNPNIQNNDWTFFPNPSNGNIQFKLDYQTPEQQIRIVDVMGKEVWKHQGFLSEKIDVSTLPSGVYFVQLNNKNYTTATKKLVIY